MIKSIRIQFDTNLLHTFAYYRIWIACVWVLCVVIHKYIAHNFLHLLYLLDSIGRKVVICKSLDPIRFAIAPSHFTTWLCTYLHSSIVAQVFFFFHSLNLAIFAFISLRFFLALFVLLSSSCSKLIADEVIFTEFFLQAKY